MQSLNEFITWFLDAIPDFLMTDAIKPLWGLMLLAYIISIFNELRR